MGLPIGEAQFKDGFTMAAHSIGLLPRIFGTICGLPIAEGLRFIDKACGLLPGAPQLIIGGPHTIGFLCGLLPQGPPIGLPIGGPQFIGEPPIWWQGLPDIMGREFIICLIIHILTPLSKIFKELKNILNFDTTRARFTPRPGKLLIEKNKIGLFYNNWLKGVEVNLEVMVVVVEKYVVSSWLEVVEVDLESSLKQYIRAGSTHFIKIIWITVASLHMRWHILTLIVIRHLITASRRTVCVLDSHNGRAGRVLFDDREEDDISNNNNTTAAAAAAAGFCASENVDSEAFVNREKRKTPSSSSSSVAAVMDERYNNNVEKKCFRKKKPKQ
ncbi:hypothetical protein AGLY_007651 [Aphis glycines]|uniref:Uncharacterized protein n=1 Tax=Aphis glycines TaxID=307491 RepID=A0A6G0TPW7_APHGL|nr:hypothetical protein AGLY_007651 [Aphis glycines]